MLISYLRLNKRGKITQVWVSIPIGMIPNNKTAEVSTRGIQPVLL